MEDFLQKNFSRKHRKTIPGSFWQHSSCTYCKRFISKIFSRFTIQVVYKSRKTFHKEAFLKLVVGPLKYFFFLFIVVIALDKLTLPSVLRFTVLCKVQSADVLFCTVYGAIIISFIRLCLRFINFIALILEEKQIEQKTSS